MDRFEAGQTVGEHDAGGQLFRLHLRHFAQHPHRILAIQSEARMHQRVGEIARVGEDQQSAGVVVEPPDRQPLAVAQPGQRIEHRSASARVVMTDDLALGLVIEQYLVQCLGDPRADAPAIDRNGVAGPLARAQ